MGRHGRADDGGRPEWQEPIDVSGHIVTRCQAPAARPRHLSHLPVPHPERQDNASTKRQPRQEVQPKPLKVLLQRRADASGLGHRLNLRLIFTHEQ
jgi:hypothetical protein